jgi:Cu-processing system permease protein
MSRTWRKVLVLAVKEFRDGVRNRWVAVTMLVLGALALALSFLGSAPVGEVDAATLEVSVVSLTSLSTYMIPLIALMVSYDALVGEYEHGTMLLLLTYPIERWQIIAGKFLGHAAILLTGILMGYGGTLVILLLANGGETTGLRAYFAMMATSLLLGCVFLALGYLVSAMARERAAAIGATIATWLLLVVLYDLGLLSVLIADQGERISEGLFSALMLVNPADAYRLFNFAGLEKLGYLLNLSGESVEFGSMAALLSMGFWVVVPLLLASVCLRKREP